MQGKYQKGIDDVVCVLETYKEKRSLFFSVSNLLPSHYLKTEYKREYHVLLLGADESGVIHRDFGSFYVDQRGEGSFFQKFTGPELSSYTHCLLVASAADAERLDIIYRGETPFFKEKEKSTVWADILRQCDEEHVLIPFSSAVDETKASWYKLSVEKQLPALLAGCKSMVEKYKHYIIGRKDERIFVGIPGRFLQIEQPCREENLFLLWQPLRGGEAFFDQKDTMTDWQADEIFGYWIAEVDMQKNCLLSL